jgi:hypothetical protein
MNNAEGMRGCTYEGGIKTGQHDYDLDRKTGAGSGEIVEELRKMEKAV